MSLTEKQREKLEGALHGIAENYQQSAKIGSLDEEDFDPEKDIELSWEKAQRMAKKAFLEMVRDVGLGGLMSEGWLDEDYWASVKISDEDLLREIEAVEIHKEEE